MNFPHPEVADAWGAPDLGEGSRSPLRSDVPLLVLAGDLDSRTPIGNAEELMAHLPNALLIVVEDASHDLDWLQRELRDAWSAFLAGQKVECSRVTAPAPRFAPLPAKR